MPTGGIPNSASIPPQYSEYRLNHENFAKTVRAIKKIEKQMAIWGKDFKPFVERIVEESIAPFQKHPAANGQNEGANQQEVGYNVHPRFC